MSRAAFDYFERIFCINLDTRPDRWERVQHEFDKLGILERVERLSGYRGSLPGSANGVVDWVNSDGNALSHMACVYEAKKSGARNVLVFEDDIEVVRSDLSDLAPAFQSLSEQDWRLFYLGPTIEVELAIKLGIAKPAHPVGPYLYRVDGPVSTVHAVAYNEPVYETILSNPYFKLDIDKFTIVDHKTTSPPVYLWDDFLGLKVSGKYCIKNFLCMQVPGYSDVEKGDTDWTPNSYRNLELLERILERDRGPVAMLIGSMRRLMRFRK